MMDSHLGFQLYQQSRRQDPYGGAYSQTSSLSGFASSSSSGTRMNPYYQAVGLRMLSDQDEQAEIRAAAQQNALSQRAKEPEAGPLPDDCPIYRREGPKKPFPWFGWLLTAACLYGLFLAGHTVWQHFQAKELAKTMTVEPVPLNGPYTGLK